MPETAIMVVLTIGVALLAIFGLAMISPILFGDETTHAAGFDDEPIIANYQRGWTIKTKAGDKVKIVCILEYQFEEIGEPYYFVQSKKTGVSYHLKESEIKPKVKK